MHILTKRDKIKNVAQHWQSQYFVKGTWKFCKRGAEAIYNQLIQLTSTATEEDIAKIIGNHSGQKTSVMIAEKILRWLLSSRRLPLNKLFMFVQNACALH